MLLLVIGLILAAIGTMYSYVAYPAEAYSELLKFGISVEKVDVITAFLGKINRLLIDVSPKIGTMWDSAAGEEMTLNRIIENIGSLATVETLKAIGVIALGALLLAMVFFRNSFFNYINEWPVLLRISWKSILLVFITIGIIVLAALNANSLLKTAEILAFIGLVVKGVVPASIKIVESAGDFAKTFLIGTTYLGWLVAAALAILCLITTPFAFISEFVPQLSNSPSGGVLLGVEKAIQAIPPVNRWQTIAVIVAVSVIVSIPVIREGWVVEVEDGSKPKVSSA